MTSEKSLIPSMENQIIITSPSQRQEEIRKILEDTIAQRLIGLKDTLAEDTILLDSGKKAVPAEEIIKTKKVLWIEKLDEKASLTEIIKQNNTNTSSIKDAIKRINVRIFDLIEVIQLLSQLESDFYSLMEEQSIQENELRAVLTDIFREKGMTEDQIFSLLDSSFKRGNILRERIASLRSDYANLQHDFKEILSIVKLFDNSIKDIQKELVKINEKFEVLDSISGRITDLSKVKADNSQLKILENTIASLKINIENEHSNFQKEANEINNKLKNVTITFAITTAALLAGLIASFLI